MTKLQQELCRIFDFDHAHWEMAHNEAQNKQKLVSTWCFVNGELGYITGFAPIENKVKVEYSNNIKDWVECESFDVFLPDSGLYVLDNACFFLEKIPLKQWRKSFNLDTFKYKTIKHHDKYDQMYFIAKAQKVPFFIGDLFVYVTTEKIGSANWDKKTITLTNPIFYQDLLDWINKEKLEWTIQ